MPELPEVETVRRGLEPVLRGRRIDRVVVRRDDLRRTLPVNFARRLAGQHVTSIERRGKYMLAHLSNRWALVIHLGMSGGFSVRSGRALGAPPLMHDHVELLLAAKGRRGPSRVSFNDPRRFGLLELVPGTFLATHDLLRDLGPDPLGADFTASWLADRFQRRSAAVKTLLLDQRIAAGVGNIYASEALHRARIAPWRPAGSLSPVRLARLRDSVQKVLERAIDAGGSSLRDFRAHDGTLGLFQHQFAVYDRDGRSCPRRGCGGKIRMQSMGGRATYWCPRCQR